MKSVTGGKNMSISIELFDLKPEKEQPDELAKKLCAALKSSVHSATEFDVPLLSRCSKLLTDYAIGDITGQGFKRGMMRIMPESERFGVS
jgi:hypothetical protein